MKTTITSQCPSEGAKLLYRHEWCVVEQDNGRQNAAKMYDIVVERNRERRVTKNRGRQVKGDGEIIRIETERESRQQDLNPDPFVIP